MTVMSTLAGEEVQSGAVEPLGWYGQHTLRQGQRGGIAHRCVAPERTDGGETQVPGARGVAALIFEIVEERQNRWRIQIFERQSTRRATRVDLEIVEEQLEGVTVARDRVRAHSSFRDEAALEESLQERWEGWLGRRHDRPTASARRANRSKRSEVIARSSGTAERYQ